MTDCHSCTGPADGKCPSCALPVCEDCVEETTIHNSGMAPRCLACVWDDERRRMREARREDERQRLLEAAAEQRRAAARRRYHSAEAVAAREAAAAQASKEAAERMERDADIIAKMMMDLGFFR